jgi:hypothetical protein
MYAYVSLDINILYHLTNVILSNVKHLCNLKTVVKKELQKGTSLDAF